MSMESTANATENHNVTLDIKDRRTGKKFGTSVELTKTNNLLLQWN